MMRTALCALLISVAMIATSAQQSRDAAKPVVAATGTAQISGSVVTAGDTPSPLRRVTVTLNGERANSRLVAVTSDDGTFAFTSLPRDRYSLTASKAGYVPAAYGSKRPGASGTPIVIAEGQRVNAPITMARGSVLSGTIRDEQGRPLPDATVTALQFKVSSATGLRALASVTIGSAGQTVQNFALDAFPGTAVTDDRGVYRIYGLAAGDYIVSASVRPPRAGPVTTGEMHQTTSADLQRAQQLIRESNPAATRDTATAPAPSSGGRVDYVPVYHPAAIARQDATTIALGSAEERLGIDVTVRLVPTARVSGTIAAIDGTAVSGAQVAIMDPLSSGVLRTTRSGFDGEFAIDGVPPGRYEMQASSYPSGLFGATNIAVEGRDVETSFMLEPGVTVSGRIVYDGTTAPPTTTLFPFLARHPWTIGGGGGEPGVTTFKMLRVVPGRYTLGLNGRPPAGWFLRSVTINGVDVTDTMFDIRRGENIESAVITLTDRPTELSGTLQDAKGQPVPEYVLIVFSADSAKWAPRNRRTQHVRPDISGRFVARELPPGDYFISAVTDVEDGQWHDPTYLAALAAASPIKITIAEGEKKVQDIRIAGR